MLTSTFKAADMHRVRAQLCLFRAPGVGLNVFHDFHEETGRACLERYSCNYPGSFCDTTDKFDVLWKWTAVFSNWRSWQVVCMTDALESNLLAVWSLWIRPQPVPLWCLHHDKKLCHMYAKEFWEVDAGYFTAELPQAALCLSCHNTVWAQKRNERNIFLAQWRQIFWARNPVLFAQMKTMTRDDYKGTGACASDVFYLSRQSHSNEAKFCWITCIPIWSMTSRLNKMKPNTLFQHL